MMPTLLDFLSSLLLLASTNSLVKVDSTLVTKGKQKVLRKSRCCSTDDAPNCYPVRLTGPTLSTVDRLTKTVKELHFFPGDFANNGTFWYQIICFLLMPLLSLLFVAVCTDATAVHRTPGADLSSADPVLGRV